MLSVMRSYMQTCHFILLNNRFSSKMESKSSKKNSDILILFVIVKT